MTKLVGLLLVGIALVGCKDKAAAPDPAPDPAAPPSQPAAPTPAAGIPSSAPGVYTLPVVPDGAAVAVSPRGYVIVTSSGTVRVGAVGPGQTFPGPEVARDQARAALETAVLGAPRPAPATKNVEGGLLPNEAAQLDGYLFIPGLGGEVRKDLSGDAARDAPVPLLLADAGAKATDVIETGAVFDQLYVGVASAKDPAARTFPVELVRQEKVEQGAILALHVRVEDETTVVDFYPAIGEVSFSVGPGEPLDPVKLAEAFAAQRAARADARDLQAVAVSARGQVTWARVVEALSASVAAGARHIILTTPALE